MFLSPNSFFITFFLAFVPKLSVSFQSPLHKSIIQTKTTMTALNAAALSQYAPAAINLFNNMKTPASILAGAMVPLGILNTLPKCQSGTENKLLKVLRHTYLLVSLLSFFSELMAVMWATVAVNQLTETVVAPAESVWHLLKRDYDLAWSGVNSHFVFGMIGFMWMIGVKAIFMVSDDRTNNFLSLATYCSVGSALSLMTSIVNRGVAKGSGDGLNYGRNILGLFSNYKILLFKQAFSMTSFGPLEAAAVTFAGITLASGVYGTFLEIKGNAKAKKLA